MKKRLIQIQLTTYMVKNKNKDNRGQQRLGCPSQGANNQKKKDRDKLNTSTTYMVQNRDKLNTNTTYMVKKQ